MDALNSKSLLYFSQTRSSLEPLPIEKEQCLFWPGFLNPGLRRPKTGVVSILIRFVDRLLGSFDNLNDMTDGLLVNSENWQALSLLQEIHKASITEIFADPPYNTGVDGFIYKDVYQHSSWLALICDRLSLLRTLMSSTGLIFLTIDFVEVSRLRLLCDMVFGSDNFLADIAWEKRYTRSNNARLFYSLKDTILCYRSSNNLSFLRESRSEKSLSNYSNPDNDSRGDWISSSYVNPATKEQRKNLSYPIYHPYRKDHIEHPTHAWKYDRRTYDQHVKDERLYWGIDGTYDYPRLKSFLSEASDGMVPIDLWHYKIAGTSDDGGNVVKSMFESAVFDNPKPPSLVQKALSLSSQHGSSGIVLDHFAGSGTTGHAVINMNREDGGRRKFILVEMADYFDTVILPRIKKVTYTPEWKNGKPKRIATAEEAERSPRIVKYIRLESYEDALNNISFDDASGQQAMQFDDYLLQYLLTWETRASETLLNVEKLTRPFAYKLHIHADGQTRERLVDIPETFSYNLDSRSESLRE